jgi:hypothetical protein
LSSQQATAPRADAAGLVIAAVEHADHPDLLEPLRERDPLHRRRDPALRIGSRITIAAPGAMARVLLALGLPGGLREGRRLLVAGPGAGELPVLLVAVG